MAKVGGESCARGESWVRGLCLRRKPGAWGVLRQDMSEEVSEAGSAWGETSGRNVYFVPVLIWMLTTLPSPAAHYLGT